MRIFILCGIFFFIMIPWVAAGSSSSHTITIRIIKPNQISIAAQDQSALQWKTDQSLKKITVAGSEETEKSGIRVQPLSRVGGQTTGAIAVSALDRELISTVSEQTGVCKLDYQSATNPPAKSEREGCRIVYTMTDI